MSVIDADRKLPEKIMARIVKTDSGCWIWQGYVAKNGYGQITYGRRTYKAHRLVYQLLVGEIENGLQLDHLCRVRNCVNPDHLDPVTQKENILRGTAPQAINARKTHCYKGHEFTQENTYLKNGYRQCRLCKSEEARKYFQAHKERITKCKVDRQRETRALQRAARDAEKVSPSPTSPPLS